MTKEEAIKTLEKSMECHDRKVCGITETCEECPLYADKDAEYEAHKVLLECLKEQEPSYYPPCIDCNKKMDEIRRAYDKLKEQEPINTLGEEMRAMQKSITDEKVLIGFNMAVALCNKHISGKENDNEVDR